MCKIVHAELPGLQNEINEKMKNSARKPLAWWIRVGRICLKRPLILSKVLFSPFRQRDFRPPNFGLTLLSKGWRGGQLCYVLVAAALVLSTAIFAGERSLPLVADASVAAIPASAAALAAPEITAGQSWRGSWQSPSAAEAEANEVNAPDTGQELIQLLKESDLWEFGDTIEIPPVVVASFPADLSGVAPEEKKRAFVHSLLPLVMIAFDEVKQERARLLLILRQLGGAENNYFTEEESLWQGALSQEDVRFIRQMTEKYRTASATELLKRIDVLPASLVIAQAAIESSWGSSRFAKEANNIFGMWTWGEKGIVPARREEGKTHKIALYDSVLDSVRAYVLTLNRVSAYGELRTIRSRTQDPMLISEGLLLYSERGEFYVDDVKRVIESYNLRGYDKFRLALSSAG